MLNWPTKKCTKRRFFPVFLQGGAGGGGALQFDLPWGDLQVLFLCDAYCVFFFVVMAQAAFSRLSASIWRHKVSGGVLTPSEEHWHEWNGLLCAR